LVTGGARGIGAAIAAEFMREGAQVVILDIAPEVSTDALYIRGSVADRDAVGAAIAATVERFGALDLLVNNAIVSGRAPLLEMRVEDVKRIWDVALWGVLHCTQLAARQMVAQGRGGNIVSISSVHAARAYPNASAYNGAKAALNQMAKTWAVELAPHR